MTTQAFDGPEHEADVRAEVRRLTERLTRAEQALAQRRPARRPGRGGRWLAAALLALLLAATPLALVAATPFDDLNPGSAHNGDIDLIYKAGITRGCVPDRRYCPNANVTNEQLASFLARTAGLGNYAPIANARTAVNATNAANAATLQGYVPADFLLAAEDVQLRYSFLGSVSSNNAVFTHSYGPETKMTPEEFLWVTTSAMLPLDVPVQMFGQELRVKSVEVCYQSDGVTPIGYTALSQGKTGEDNLIVEDTTAHDSTTSACYTLTPAAPAPITGALYLKVNALFEAADSYIKLYSVRLVLRPYS